MSELARFYTRLEFYAECPHCMGDCYLAHGDTMPEEDQLWECPHCEKDFHTKGIPRK